MNTNFKGKEIGWDLLQDLKNNKGQKYSQLNEAIIKEFGIKEDEYEIFFEENELRVYEGICYEAIKDAWFYVQHIWSHVDIEVKEDGFKIIPPNEYINSFKEDELIYNSNTEETLKKAFFDSRMKHLTRCININNTEYFVCMDEI